MLGRLKLLPILPFRHLNRSATFAVCREQPMQHKLSTFFSTTSIAIEKRQDYNELLKELDLQIYRNIPSNQLNSQQIIKGQAYLLKLRQQFLTEKESLLHQIRQVIRYIHQNNQKMNQSLKDIDLTSQELINQFGKITQKLHKLAENYDQFEQDELIQKSHFYRSIKNYLTDKWELQEKKKIFRQAFKVAYIVEACCKIRDLLLFFKIFEIPTCIINSHPSKYSQAWKRIQLVKFPNEGNTTEQYHQFQLLMHCLGGAYMTYSGHSNIFIEHLNITWAFLKSSINFKKGILKNMEMHYKSIFDKIVKKINIAEEGMFRTIFQEGYPKIKTNQMIYIPLDSEKDEQWDIFTQKSEAIPVRIFHSEKLPRKNSTRDKKIIKNILVHIHGGGYVALTSRGSQSFTRAWTNEVKMPLFSIDYRLAPDHQFPQPIFDCLRAYEFIVKKIHKYFDIAPENIFLLGDSAGGCIACGLMALILQKGLKSPLGMFLVYPNLDSRGIFYGSRKYILEEPLLWPSVIKLAYDKYFPENHDFSNPLGSPLLLTEQFVGGQKGDQRFPLKWPKTYIHVGSHETMRDEALIFIQKLVESGIDCKCFIMDKLRHAYLGSEGMIPSSKGVTNHSTKMVKQLIFSLIKPENQNKE